MDLLIDIIKASSVPLAPIDANINASLKKISGIKSVVFDIYGTLVVSGVGDISHSSEENRKHAILEVFENLKISLKDTDLPVGDEFFRIVKEQQAFIRKKGVEYPEIDIREVWSEFIKTHTEYGSELAQNNDLIEELSTRFELRVNGTWPMPNLSPTLENLRKNGYELGIVSNAQFFTPLLFEAYLGKSIKEMGFQEDLCQWSYDYKEAKPSTRMYRANALTLEAKYGIQANEVLYVGNDMLNDVLPAHQSGFKTALFAGDKRSLRLRTDDDRLNGINPDLTITDLNQIIDCIS